MFSIIISCFVTLLFTQHFGMSTHDLFIFSVVMLAPCLRTLPAANFDISHKRYKRRYLDFMISPKSRNVIQTRARIIRYLRQFLEDRGFLEVETPILGRVETNTIKERD